MTTTSDTPTSPQPPEPGPRRFERSSSDRIIGGVCGGLGRYFGIDSTLVRIAFVALAFLGGTGLVIYAAALLLVPQDGETPPSPTSTRDRAIAAGAAIALTIAGFALGLFGGFGFGGALVPVAFLLLAGLTVWWLASGERPSGSPGDVLRRALLGFGLLVGCAALAVGSFFASGLGGGVVVAGLVIAAGAGLVAAAFIGGARWLVLPALALALPLAFVSAAGIDLDGGFGDRHERPATLAEVQDGYRLGAGELVVDLRGVDLPPGDHRLTVGIGAGHALVLVRDDVCVASKASVGMGRSRSSTMTAPASTSTGTTAAAPRRARPGSSSTATSGSGCWRSATATTTATGAGSARTARTSATPPARRRLPPRGRRVRRRASPDAVSLTAGIALVVLGTVLLLDRTGTLALTFGSMAPIAFGAVGAILLASGLSRDRRER